MVALVDEFERCNFGDSRLIKRVKVFSESISKNPETSVHAACGSAVASKAAYRFLQNEKVSSNGILDGHVLNTIDRISNYEGQVLIIQDTTDLVFTHYPSIKDLGEIHKAEGYSSGVKGVHLHSSLATTESGVPLGILKQSFFTYEDYRALQARKEINQKDIHKQIPIEQKKSFRWIEHLRDTNAQTESIGRRVIHVADRECDIYEFLHEFDSQNNSYVVRSSLDRRVLQQGKVSKIESCVEQAKCLGMISVEKVNKKIDCRVKHLQITLKPPYRSPSAKSATLYPIDLNVIDIKSVEPGQLHWRLLTNLPCDKFTEALKVIKIYKCRWSIECFHRILKSGFGIEKARLNGRSRIENFAALLSVVSWHIFWLYQFGREIPCFPANKIFDKVSLKVLKISAKKLNVKFQEILTVAQAVKVLARLGGFADRKNDGPPGMINIWRGWRKLQDRIAFMEQLTYG